MQAIDSMLTYIFTVIHLLILITDTQAYVRQHFALVYQTPRAPVSNKYRVYEKQKIKSARPSDSPAPRRPAVRRLQSPRLVSVSNIQVKISRIELKVSQISECGACLVRLLCVGVCLPSRISMACAWAI